MKSRTWVSGLVICAAVALAISSCSKNPIAPKAADLSGPPDTFPPIPQPSTPDELIPDTSLVYSADVPIAGKQVDFAPLWSAGTFTWHIEVQTQRPGPCLACTNADPPGGYWDGTRPNSALVFESGAVDLRNPTPSGGKPGTWYVPQPRRIEFVQAGADVVPFNPDKNDTDFLYLGYEPKHIAPALFGGYVIRPETPAFGETARQAEYFVAALSCPQLTNPVYVRRERYWQRVGMNGSNLKSVRVDPGTQLQVSYAYSRGVNYSNSYAFTQTLNGEVSVGSEKSVVGAKLGGSLQQTFGTGVNVSQDTTITVTRTYNGVDGKTVIYSLWTSVERYTFVDKDGNPYTDPNFTFADLGSAVIQGEYEWISSTSFPKGTTEAQPAAAQPVVARPAAAQPATGQRAAARSVDGKAKVLSVTW